MSIYLSCPLGNPLGTQGRRVIEGQVAVTSGSKGSVSHRSGIRPVPITICPLSFVKIIRVIRRS